MDECTLFYLDIVAMETHEFELQGLKLISWELILHSLFLGGIAYCLKTKG